MQKIKLRKAPGPLEVGVKIIIARGEIKVLMIMDLCQCELGGREIPDE